MNKVLLGIILAFLLCACNAPQETAGGSDLPNGIMSGVVLSSSGKPASDVSLSLKSVVIGPRKDSIVDEKPVHSDASGNFTIDGVSNGTYILTATDSRTGESAILARITKSADTLAGVTVQTAKPHTIHGRVIPSGTSKATEIRVPGTDIIASVDTGGFYTLNDVPAGDIEFLICNTKSSNILQVSISPEIVRDSMFIRDCKFNDNSAANYTFHPVSGIVTEAYPILYNAGSDPDWYSDIDFSGVTYQKSSVTDPRPLWQFPVMVLVTPGTLVHYESIDSIKKLVTAQFQKANEFLSDSSIEGNIQFTVDSIGEYTDNASIPVDPLPSQFSVRVIYDGEMKIGTNAFWDNSCRTGLFSVDFNQSEGMFSDSATAILTQLLAASRGAELLTISKFGIKESEFRDSTSFSQPSLLMWGKGGTVLDDQTIGTFNINKELYSPLYFPGESDTPENLELQFTHKGTIIKNAMVKVFGLFPTGKLTTTPQYASYTDSDGVYYFPENPYKVYGVQYSNLFITVQIGNLNYYQWVPKYEVRGKWLLKNEPTIRILLEL